MQLKAWTVLKISAKDFRKNKEVNLCTLSITLIGSIVWIVKTTKSKQKSEEYWRGKYPVLTLIYKVRYLVSNWYRHRLVMCQYARGKILHLKSAPYPLAIKRSINLSIKIKASLSYSRMKTLEWSSEIERLYRNIATSNLILQLELLNATWLNLTQHRR